MFRLNIGGREAVGGFREVSGFDTEANLVEKVGDKEGSSEPPTAETITEADSPAGDEAADNAALRGDPLVKSALQVRLLSAAGPGGPPQLGASGAQPFRSSTVDDIAVYALADYARSLKKEGRVELMKEIAQRFGIPDDGFAGRQAHLYERSDVRLFGTLRKLTEPRNANAAEANLDKVARHFPEQSLSLALVTAAREADQSITDHSRRPINTFHQGGLDFLWENRNRLGLPDTVIRHWRPAPVVTNTETGNEVHPALIPRNDQVLAYAAQTRSSYRNFETYVKKELGETTGGQALANMSDDARLAWQAYAFLSPGGNKFGPGVFGQKFGVRTAFQYLVDKANKEGRPIDMNEILTDPVLPRKAEVVSSARVRAAEAAFLEALASRTDARLQDIYLRTQDRDR